MKKTNDKPSKTMLAALQSLDADGRQKTAAFRFLRSNLSKLRTLEDVEQAASGLLAAQQLLGPIDDGYRKTLESLGKTLDRTIKRALIPAAQCSVCKAELKGLWDGACELFSKYVPAKLWAQVKDKAARFFEFK